MYWSYKLKHSKGKGNVVVGAPYQHKPNPECGSADESPTNPTFLPHEALIIRSTRQIVFVWVGCQIGATAFVGAGYGKELEEEILLKDGWSAVALETKRYGTQFCRCSRYRELAECWNVALYRLKKELDTHQLVVFLAAYNIWNGPLFTISWNVESCMIEEKFSLIILL
uniref:Uncharacterized protein n=1 Tax=Nelumbo nucifera TaxID=4432 RepID=A0A822ZT76_NELNU|nr:TPA_asm: hypothetical protein HUJ06_016456 [Nelumbo nucifera]